MQTIEYKELVFYTTLPGSYKPFGYSLVNKTATPTEKEVYNRIMGWIDRSIRLRRVYAPAVLKDIQVRLYPKAEYTGGNDEVFSFSLDPTSGVSKTECIVSFHAPYLLDMETCMTARVYADEVGYSETGKFLKADSQRMEEIAYNNR